MAEDTGFLSRWSRRKVAVREGQGLPADPPLTQPASDAPPPEPPVAVPAAAAAAPAPEPAPLTLDDVAQLTRESDYGAFVSPKVAPEVRNAALKKLFTDPHFNVMDGLDIYIDDYGKPDPLPPGMLRQMVQSKLLGLFDDEPDDPAQECPEGAPQAAALATPAALTPLPLPDPPAPPHEDADLQLQPDPAAGCAGLEGGAGQDQHRGPASQH
jgi:Protein of unknown function (DUF3306)